MFPVDDKAGLSNILLASDLDGTLLTDDKRILDIDKRAIRKLQEEGGLFTIATGRGVTLTRTAAEVLEPNLPAVVFNGAALYDYKRDCFIWSLTLPATVREHILSIAERFPTTGVEILIGCEVYVINSNPIEEEHINLGNPNPIRCPLEHVPPSGWIKILLADEPSMIDKVAEFANSLGLIDIHMVRSAPVYFEILPHGANKGNGIEKLVELKGLHERSVVAVGDYDNDLEMLEMADVKIAVANAESAVKALADIIVCDNNSGAIFEIVELLKKNV